MIKKIFWAFDAFDESLRTNVFVGETLSELNEKLKSDIQPVFVLGPDAVNLIPVFESGIISEMTSVAELQMRDLLSRVKIPGVLSPTVISEDSFSKTKLVKTFINYAVKNGADLIVLGSHGKQGIERALLGSFAETLLLHSHLPALVIGQNFDQISKFDEILFPTDFGDDSLFAFHKALELAMLLRSNVTLFHHLSPIINPAIQSAMAPFGGVWVSYPDEMINMKTQKHKLLKEWAMIAKEKNIVVKTVLDTSTTNTSEAILSYSTSNETGLITMGAQSGQLATTLFGAISRKIVRRAHCPVWLLRKN